MFGMFFYCYSLISLDLSNFNTSEVLFMDCMFYGCSSLISLDLSNFDTSKVTIMSYMFFNCSSLISLDLSSFDTSQLYAVAGDELGMIGMFAYCYSLTSLNLFNFNISKEIDINGIFYNCMNLSHINFGNATIQNEAIILELKQASQNLYIILNNESLSFLLSLNDTFNFSYDIWGYIRLEEIINSTILLEDYIYHATNVINNSNSLNLLNNSNIEEFIYTTNFVSELINNNFNNLNYSNIKDKNQLIKNIRKNLINGKFSSNNNEEFYYEFKEDNIIIEITNTEKEKNKEKNKTSINLGNCEYILKKEYNISYNSYLYFL